MCRKVIETRAAEFARPASTYLTPEQRLLIQQQLRRSSTNTEKAARPVSREGEAHSLEGLGDASADQSPAPAPEEPALDPVDEAAAAAAVLDMLERPAPSLIPPR